MTNKEGLHRAVQPLCCYGAYTFAQLFLIACWQISKS